MVTCATPTCGLPGRPFAACGMCKQRRYCSSCSFELTPHLVEQVTTNSSNCIDEEKRLCKSVIDVLKSCSSISICPPCYDTISPFIISESTSDVSDLDIDNCEK